MENGSPPQLRDTSHLPLTVPKKKGGAFWVLYGIIGSLLLALVILAILFGISLLQPTKIDVIPPPITVNPAPSPPPPPSPHSPPRPSENRTEPVYSPGYLRAALRLHSMVNASVDPCDDFYEYANGKAIAETEIPVHRSKYGVIERLTEKTSQQMDRLLRSPEPSSSKAIEKVKVFYRSCSNEKENTTLVLQFALEKVKSLGEFPLLQGETVNNFSWPEYIISLAKKGQKPLIFDIGTSEDDTNRSRKILTFSGEAEGIPLESHYWLNETLFGNLTQAYKKKVMKILGLLAEDAKLPLNPQLGEELDDLFTFYRRLAKIRTSTLERGLQGLWGEPSTKEKELVEYKTSTEEKFGSLVRRFESKTGLNLRLLLKTLAPVLTQFLSDGSLAVEVYSPHFEGQLASLIQETSPNTWKNFYQWNILESYIKRFPEKYIAVNQEFNQMMDEAGEEFSKWEECLKLFSRQEPGLELGDAFGALYVRKYWKKDAIREIREMTENIRESFSQIIQETDWLDAETKENALVKLKNIVTNIGYQDNAFDDVQLDDKYKDLNISQGMPFIKVNEECKRWAEMEEWKGFLKPFDRQEFAKTAAEVNAFYSSFVNSITIPAAIIQDLFYDNEGPKSLNYGGIGAVIGHELTHGFDSNERHYDELGNSRNWWTNSSDKAFNERAKVMEEQYDNFELKEIGKRMDGKRTLEENISDNGGIKEAFRAYKAYLAKNGRETPIPGFDYTNEQLFYIGWGQVWNSKETPESLAASIWGTHSPNRARVNVVLSNQPDFAEAFNCPAGSPMNPVKKVVVEPTLVGVARCRLGQIMQIPPEQERPLLSPF